MIQANRDNQPVTDSNWSIQSVKEMSFTGAVGLGAIGTATLFTVTGAVLMRLFGRATVAPAKASTSPSASISPSSSASASASPSASISPSASTSPSSSASSSISASVSPSSSASPSASASGSPSSSLSPSSSVSPSLSPSLSPSSSISPSTSVSPSLSPSASVSPSASGSPSSSVSASVSPSASGSPSASVSPSSSVSPSPSAGTTSISQIAVGTATNPTSLLPTTFANYVTANKIWYNATPSNTIENSSVLVQKIVTENVIQTVTQQPINTGNIEYVAMWFPLTPDSSVVAA